RKRKVHAGGGRPIEKVAGRIEETTFLHREAERVESGQPPVKERQPRRATARDVQLLRQRKRKRIVVYSNLLSVVAEGCDQQWQHSDARAKRHREKDRGSGIAEEEVAAKDHKGEEVAVTQRRKVISSDSYCLLQ
ncbi:hypothetical protein B296_00029241, partial [Ensete ventricosum]